MYEARGWWHQSRIAEVVPPLDSLTVAFVGDFSRQAPSEAMLQQLDALLEIGRERGRLAEDYRVNGVRYVAEGGESGKALFDALKERLLHWDVLINVI